MDYNEIDKIYSKLLQINNIMETNLSSIAKNYGLNVTELMILVDIKANPNTDLNAVCLRLGMKKSAVSKSVLKLINNGFISKCSDVSDHRKVALNFLVKKDIEICKESTLINTFISAEKHSCNFTAILKSLDDIIDLLSK